MGRWAAMEAVCRGKGGGAEEKMGRLGEAVEVYWGGHATMCQGSIVTGSGAIVWALTWSEYCAGMMWGPSTSVTMDVVCQELRRGVLSLGQ